MDLQPVRSEFTELKDTGKLQRARPRRGTDSRLFLLSGPDERKHSILLWSSPTHTLLFLGVSDYYLRCSCLAGVQSQRTRDRYAVDYQVLFLLACAAPCSNEVKTFSVPLPVAGRPRCARSDLLLFVRQRGSPTHRKEQGTIYKNRETYFSKQGYSPAEAAAEAAAAANSATKSKREKERYVAYIPTKRGTEREFRRGDVELIMKKRFYHRAEFSLSTNEHE